MENENLEPERPRYATSPFQAAMRRFEYNRLQFEREQRMLREPEDDQEPFRRLMRRFGRAW